MIGNEERRFERNHIAQKNSMFAYFHCEASGLREKTGFERPEELGLPRSPMTAPGIQLLKYAEGSQESVLTL